MQGKRPFYLIIAALVLLNLVATNLQAHEVQTAYKTRLAYNLPINFEFTSGR